MGDALAERLLRSIDWSGLRSAGGSGEGVRDALAALLSSNSGEAAERAYWGVENHAVVQGELFSVAEASTAVLISALADRRERWIRIAVLELLFQIVSGYPSEAPDTPADIVSRCEACVREGLWLLLREVVDGEQEAALYLLDQLGEGERARALLGPDHE